MRALTIYAPWSTLIIVGAKPYEFRKWDFSTKPGLAKLIGQRIAIHASARLIVLDEVFDIIDRIEDGESALDVEKAKPVLNLIVDTAMRYGGKRGARCLPLSAVLGTAVIGKPVRAYDLFKDKVADSSRIDQHIFAWPITDVVQFDVPIPYRGAQGFWTFPDGLLP
jgi:hypothetical protein